MDVSVQAKRSSVLRSRGGLVEGDFGGGIKKTALLTPTDSTIGKLVSTGSSSGGGGGIYSSGMLTVSSSTIDNNSVFAADGWYAWGGGIGSLDADRGQWHH